MSISDCSAHQGSPTYDLLCCRSPGNGVMQFTKLPHVIMLYYVVEIARKRSRYGTIFSVVTVAPYRECRLCHNSSGKKLISSSIYSVT